MEDGGGGMWLIIFKEAFVVLYIGLGFAWGWDSVAYLYGLGVGATF